MKRFALAITFLAVFACTSRAQGPDAFTITTYQELSGTAQTNYRHPHLLPSDFSPDPCTSSNPYCGVQTGWNEPCPEGLNCGGGTPYCPFVGCGTVQLTAQVSSGIDIPWYLNFPNGGNLLQDCALTYNPIQFNLRPDGTMADGSKVGDTWYFTASTGTSCSGYAQGVTFSVTTNWTTTLVKPYCGRGGCATNYSYQLTGGSGVARYTAP